MTPSPQTGERLIRKRLSRESAIDDYHRMRSHERWRNVDYCAKNPSLTHAQSVVRSVMERVAILTELEATLRFDSIY